MSYGVVFALVNAQQSPEVVGQLVDTLAPFPVCLHHDFGQQPDFPLDRDNLRYVTDPVHTGWATWGFTSAVLKVLRMAVAVEGCEYVQLVSPTCLPVRSVERFVEHVRMQPAEANMDLMHLEDDDATLWTYAYRAYAPAGSLRAGLLARLCLAGCEPWPAAIQRSGLMVRTLRSDDGPVTRILRGAARTMVTLARDGWLGRHPFVGDRSPAVVGSTWFGARREVVQAMLDLAADPARLAAFERIKNSDEHLLPSLLVATSADIAPSNHYVSRFDRVGHPRWLTEGDLPRVRASGKWFARKFPDDPDAPVRLRALGELHADAVSPGTPAV